MEKFGVETDESVTKEATGDATKRCPICRAPLLSSADSNVSRCPVHGTEPFETR